MTYSQQLQCCSGYGPLPNCQSMVIFVKLYNFFTQTAICSSTCGTNKQCTAPDTCTCVSGWTGSNCLTRMNIYLFEPIILFYLNTAICNTQCNTNMECTAPNTCTCMTGWTGSDCLTGILNYLHIILLYFYLISYL